MNDLELTGEEAERFRKAFKNEEFVKMFKSYMDEISDPQNREASLYERELTQLEAERGNNVTFIKPEPFFVIKTRLTGSWSGVGKDENASVLLEGKVGTKLFINIATSGLVEEPKVEAVVEGTKIGQNWRLPYSIIPIRPDLDKQGNTCLVVDVIFHPNVRTEIENSYSLAFKEMVISTGIEGIANTYPAIPFDQKTYTLPKCDYKGMIKSAVFREPLKKKQAKNGEKGEKTISSLEFLESLAREKEKQSKESTKENNASTDTQAKENNMPAKPLIQELDAPKSTCIDLKPPKHQITYRSNVTDWGGYVNASPVPAAATGVPDVLAVKLFLPLVGKLTEISDAVNVESQTVKVSVIPGKYDELTIKLPYPCLPDLCKAKWDGKRHEMLIEIPVDLKAIKRPEPKPAIVIEQQQCEEEDESECKAVDEVISEKKETLEQKPQEAEESQAVDPSLFGKLDASILEFLD